MFDKIYKDKKIFITGHTGFKGSWLAFWLHTLGAKITGYSVDKDNKIHHEKLNLNINNIYDDIINYNNLQNAVQKAQPEIIFHLAAQPLVLDSYNDPLHTFQTNIIGTSNLLECCRHIDSIKVIIVITTDKVYDNKNWSWGYRELDKLGGNDPYSVSKTCTEFICKSYSNSFLKKQNKLLATVRAGNVIGGGDWSPYRLIPDIIRTQFLNDELYIRNPGAVRPWQHVLEPLSGYLELGKNLLNGKFEFEGAWNFGPELESAISVEELINITKNIFPELKVSYKESKHHEENYLHLDSTKANRVLKWKPVWDINDTLSFTLEWYKKFYQKNELNTKYDLEKYIKDATNKRLNWTKNEI